MGFKQNGDSVGFGVTSTEQKAKRSLALSRALSHAPCYASRQAIEPMESRVLMSGTSIVVWNFNDAATSGTTGNAANVAKLESSDRPNGVATLTTTINATDATSGLTSFGGTTVGADPGSGDTAGASLVVLGGKATTVGTTTTYANNGQSVTFPVSTTGSPAYTNIVVTYATQGTATGFTSDTFQYSIDGTTFTNASGGTYTPPTAFALKTFDLSSVTGLTNDPNAAFRIVFNGATGATGNNRIDNFIVSGTANQPGTPVVGALAVTPATEGAGAGSTVTLSATNVVQTNGLGTIANVKFYRESSGDSTLEIGTDTLVGTATQVGTTSNYNLSNVSISSLPAGTYTYYAVATDSNGADSSATPVTATQTLATGDNASFNSSSYSVNEAVSGGLATITVTLGTPAASPTTISYATSDGTHFPDPVNTNVDAAAVAGRDYTPTSGTLNFATGASSASFTVPILNVKTFAGTRYVNLTLSNPGTGLVLGPVSTATLAITDNTVTAPNGVDTNLNSTPTYTAELTTAAPAAVNGFLALSSSAFTGSPDAPIIEFSSAATSLFPTAYVVNTIDSLKLSLYNTATTGTFAGIPGNFDLYILTNDTDPVGASTYHYFGPDGTTVSGNVGNTGPSVIGSQGSPALVGTATFTNNVSGFNDFVFDNLSSTVKTFLTGALNNKTAVRFVIIPSAGSPVSADWEGNTTNTAFAFEKPVLTVLAEKSATVSETFALDPATVSVTVNKGGSVTVTVDRTSTGDISDTATVNYNTSDGTAVSPTDYTGVTSGTITFAANAATASITIPTAAGTAVSADKQFTVNLYNPHANGTARLSSLGSPAVETVTIHDIRTTNLVAGATDLATVQTTGPRTGANGKAFFNVEGSGSGAFASFGVLDYNTPAGGNTYSFPSSTSVLGINSITLATVNSPASFTATGAVDAYLVEDSTTDISPSNTSLIFDTTDPTEGLNGQLGPKHLLGSFIFNASQSAANYTNIPLTSADAATLSLLRTDLNFNKKFRIVLTPEDATVAATYVGLPVTGGTSQPPTLTFNVTTVALPRWLAPESIATFNQSTETLNVTGASTIIADPAAFNDSSVAITASGATAVLGTSLPANSAIHIGSLTLTSGAVTSLAGSNLPILFTSGLSIDGTSKLDVGNGYLDVTGSTLSAVTGLIASGYNNGLWNGSGIDSSTAAANTTHLTGLGVISNTGQFTTFDGATVHNGDVLVKYTYVGDANLDGKVDGSDYSRIDSGVISSASGFYNGDLNYDGVINGSDYTLIDNAYNTQGTAFSPAAQIAAAASVPAFATPPSARFISTATDSFFSDKKVKISLVAELEDLVTGV